MKYTSTLLFAMLIAYAASAQSSASAKTTSTKKVTYSFKKPVVTVHFGKGNVMDLNVPQYNYSRVAHYCPSDGHYTYSSSTANCFGGDWFNFDEDHTAGDADGNMLIVNSSYRTGEFFSMPIEGLQPNTNYEFAVWLVNVCRPSEKCPYPLLPDISIKLEDENGKLPMQVSTGEIQRNSSPEWTQYKTLFTTPSTISKLRLVMINSAPGGCGNDFAMDDITFRERVKTVTETVAKAPPKQPTVTTASLVPTKKATVASTPASKPVTTTKPPAKKAAAPTPAKKQAAPSTLAKTETPSRSVEIPEAKKTVMVMPPAPKALTSRANPLVKQIDIEAGDIIVELYDNGQIDGDTVSIYHNNILIVSRARLSQQPISFKIKMNHEKPHHEIVMVAENLGSIPPNTSVMIVRAGEAKHEVFISSSEQKNAKVVFNLK